ncbi:STM4015 family protein [Actinomadura xylanilytica]|uniref:STM4015 family protein n=1 Tax=Actinomadura xylanilytica TaxID=887459 RepID=UPI00255A90D9|nr:STM4015 family protein [Actinomadura xylanilytica]MDL4775104.1 STM4015 family protein [Actinomadura xylanilytica]
MRKNDHLDEFAGLPVAEFHLGITADDPLPPADEVAWRVSTVTDGGPIDPVFAHFLETVDTARLTTLVIGFWGPDYSLDPAYEDPDDPVPLLVAAADRFPNLRALFWGDIVQRDSEISYIEPYDITPLFTAFPGLERLEARGAPDLLPVRSEALKVLRLESGGLPGRDVRGLAASDLPALEHLDVWLGAAYYGGDATVADLAPLLTGERLPALRHLGLEDSEIQDEVAAAVAGAPVVARLESLSLALGNLTDQGAEALVSGQPLTHLRRLDLHHHFLSDPMVERVRAALPGVDVDLGAQQDDNETYIAFAE